MAYAITAAASVKIASNVEGASVNRRVKNNGPNTAYVARDPAVTPTSQTEFSVPLNGEETISLAPGEELYAICAATQTASLEVI